MDMNKSQILIAAASIICLCNWWTNRALGTEKATGRERLAKVAGGRAAHRVPSRPSDAIIYKQLAKTVDLSSLTLNTPISSAIEILRNSTEPALNIVVLWKDLRENALVEQDTPISMDGVSGIRLRTALELLLRAVSSGPRELGYVVDGGVIIIATKESLPIKRVTRVYDISDLVAAPANYRFGLPVGPFGLAAPGFGGGWMGQGPVGPAGGWGASGLAAGGYTRQRALPYRQGLRGQRANEVGDLIRGSVAPGSWR